MNEVSGPDSVSDGWVRRIGVPIRVGHGVEVIQIAEELVEAVHAGKIFVQVAEMILAKLAGGVAHRLERRSDGWCLRWQDRHRRLPDLPWSAPCGLEVRP